MGFGFVCERGKNTTIASSRYLFTMITSNDDEESQTLSLLSPGAPTQTENQIGSETSQRHPARIGFWEYESLQSDEIDEDGMIHPLKFRGTTRWYVIKQAVLVRAPFLLCSLLVREILTRSLAIKDTFWELACGSPYVMIFTTIVINVHDWRYFCKHGPIKYSEMLLRTLVCHCHNQVIILRVRLQMARYHLICRDYDSAMSCCERVQDLSIVQKHVYYFIVVSQLKVQILSHMERYEEAVQCMKEMIDKEISFAKSPLPLSVLKCDYKKLARLQTKLGRNDEAIETYEEVVKLLHDRKLQKNGEMGHILVSMGDVMVKLRKHDEAMDLYGKGLEIFQMNYGEFPRQTSMATLHESIGDLYKERVEVGLAKENYEIALEVLRRSGRSDSDRLVAALMIKIRNLVDSSV